jgi:hypothetical protein
MNDPRRYDELRANEWECIACYSINEEDAERCWNCNADQDGYDGNATDEPEPEPEPDPMDEPEPDPMDEP